ncbi:MAG: hypothetical protein ACOC5T_01460 [Elusimicrobiota bacterium]
MKKVIKVKNIEESLKEIVQSAVGIFEKKIDDLIITQEEDHSVIGIIVRDRADKVKYKSIVHAKQLARQYINENKSKDVLLELRLYLEQFTKQQRNIIYRVIGPIVSRKEIEQIGD